jgi:hypothetical protein
MGLYLDDVKEMIEEQPDKSYYEREFRRMITLGEAVEWDRIDLLGVEHDIKRTLDLNLEQKRDFKVTPRTGAELMKGQYDSRPWKIEGEKEK